MERVAAYSLVTAVALAESVAATLGGERVQVKWPNDLLIDGRKAAGVLTELHVAPGGAEWVIIGVGINVNIPAEGFPPELPNATSLCAASGEQWDREALLQAFLDNLSEQVDSFSRSGGVLDVDRWSQWANVGATVRIVENDRERVATVLGLTESGALRVRDEEGRSHEIIAGDVVPLSWED
jgi:BirA family biotin operon repressor/biotin-[acetyl-CoA-carboxylase] ligase